MGSRRRDFCRVCSGSNLRSVLDLGMQPCANALPADPSEFEKEPRYPLELFLCEGCGHLQILDVVDPEELFGHYLYLTGTSSTMRDHFARYARAMAARCGLGPGARVVEVASNDGCLLASFHAEGAEVLGIEPARNVAERARASGVETLSSFFDEGCARTVREERGAFDLAVANNVLAHVDDPLDFLRGLRRLVEPEGRVVVEVPWAGQMFDRLEFDTIYHEHLSCFLAGPLGTLVRRAGLAVEEYWHEPVHGGTLRLLLTPCSADADHAAPFRELVETESARGLHGPQAWEAFAEKARGLRDALTDLLRSERDAGRLVAGYGAPAKGHTLLNFCGIGPELLGFTVDKNPLKAGRWTPGSHIPILTPDAIEERKPDLLLILPWNLAEEIMEQEDSHRARGGRFLIPIPEPRILT